jgi:glycerate kinase
MKILVAPNSFKESLSSIEVAHHIGKGLKMASGKYQVVELPLADGGTGTSLIVTRARNGMFVKCSVSGPLNKKVSAMYGVIPQQKTAVIELAEAAGLKLVPEKIRNPLMTSTRGVGELMRDAITRGYKTIILAIGDSSTIDCGVGALSILGIRFLNKAGTEIELNCRGLLDLDKIEMSGVTTELVDIRVTIASDVKNILTGRYGALVYAKQKGAKRKDLPVIHRALKNFKKVILKQYGLNLDKITGAGAAGGIGGAFVAIMGAEIISGFRLVRDVVYLEDAIKNSDLIITGEGRIDRESFYGKSLKKVIDLAYIHKKPILLIAGSIAHDTTVLKKYHVIEQYSLLKLSKSLKKSMENAPQLLERLAYSIGSTIVKMGSSMNKRYT